MAARKTTTTPTEPATKVAKAKAAQPAKAKAKKAKADPKAKKLSALDATTKALGEIGQAMTCQELIDAMAAKGYWTSPNGKTPAQTLYQVASWALLLRPCRAKMGTA
jgi:hypothetical protein